MASALSRLELSIYADYINVYGPCHARRHLRESYPTREDTQVVKKTFPELSRSVAFSRGKPCNWAERAAARGDERTQAVLASAAFIAAVVFIIT